jgi:hypothetical protein
MTIMVSTSSYIRGQERLRVEWRETPRGLALIIFAVEQTRSFSFHDFPAFEKFRLDMERFLLRSGWSVLDFAETPLANPDRLTDSTPRAAIRRL